jgi:hypothetical protein
MTEPTAKDRARAKRDRVRRARLGICARCKSPAAAERSMCRRHLTWDASRSLARYHAKRRPAHRRAA